MFWGPFCLAVHKGNERWGGWEYYFSATSYKEILYCFQKSLSTNASCHRRSVLSHFDTAVWYTAVCYKIVVLDSVKKGWNWARAVSLIFHLTWALIVEWESFQWVAIWKQRCLARALREEACVVQSCLGRGRPGRAGVSVSVCLGSVRSCSAVLQEVVRDDAPSLPRHSCWLGLLILSVCLYHSPYHLKSVSFPVLNLNTTY